LKGNSRIVLRPEKVIGEKSSCPYSSPLVYDTIITEKVNENNPLQMWNTAMPKMHFITLNFCDIIPSKAVIIW